MPKGTTLYALFGGRFCNNNLNLKVAEHITVKIGTGIDTSLSRLL